MSISDYILPVVGILFVCASIVYAKRETLLRSYLSHKVAQEKASEERRIEEWSQDVDDIVYTHPKCSRDMKWRIVNFGIHDISQSHCYAGLVSQHPFPILSIKTQDGNDLLDLVRAYCGPNHDWHENVISSTYTGQLRDLRYTDLDPNATNVTIFQMDVAPYERKFDATHSVVDSVTYFLEAASKTN